MRISIPADRIIAELVSAKPYYIIIFHRVLQSAALSRTAQLLMDVLYKIPAPIHCFSTIY